MVIRITGQEKVLHRATLEQVLEKTGKGYLVPGASPVGSSYWKKILQCPREHYLGNIVQLRLRPSKDLAVETGTPSFKEALDVGSLYHLALQTYYEAIYMQQHKQVLSAAPETLAFDVLRPFVSEPGYGETYETVERLLDAYFNKYRNDLQQWEVLAVEVTMACDPVETGFPWSARFDLVVVDHAVSKGATFVIEHKTSGNLDKVTIQGYTQDLQVMGQIWLWSKEVDLSSYPPFLGAQVNLISKAKDVKLLRVPVSPTPAALQNWEDSQRKFYALSHLYESMGYPQNFAACTRRYGHCEYFDVCRYHTDFSLSQLATLKNLDSETDIGAESGTS